MSKLTHYTLELYRRDLRTTQGIKLVEKRDFAPVTRDYIDTIVQGLSRQGYIVELNETYITRKNFMSGQVYTERYDTPYYCSPSSESYFTN